MSIASIGIYAPQYAGKVETFQKGFYVITKNNQGLGYTIIGIMVDLFVICIVISVISGIVSIISLISSIMMIDSHPIQTLYKKTTGINYDYDHLYYNSGLLDIGQEHQGACGASEECGLD